MTLINPIKPPLFNFAQAIDQKCLSLVYQETVRQAPNTDIILVGTCLGAMNILKFTAQYTRLSNTKNK